MPGLLGLGIRYLPQNPMPDTKGTIKVSTENPVDFKLGEVTDNFSGLIVRLENPTRTDTNLNIDILNQQGLKVASAAVNGLNTQDGSDTKFIFSPLPKGFYNVRLTSALESGDAGVMGVYLRTDNQQPAFVTLIKPSSRIGLIKGVYVGWLKHLLRIL